MKNLRNILLGLLSIIAYTSCDDQLDINPRQLVATSEVLVNEENLTSVLFGAYAGLKGTFGTNEGGELYGGDFNPHQRDAGSRRQRCLGRFLLYLQGGVQQRDDHHQPHDPGQLDPGI